MTEGASKVSLMLGDCLDRMKEIPDGSVDMVMADLPYGTTACKWDSVIPFEPLWEQYKRVCKKNSAIVLTASQPFTTKLIVSNYENFRYELIWDKHRPTGFALANKQPMKVHENICVFYVSQPTYNPQKTIGRPNNAQTKGNKGEGMATGKGSQPILKKTITDTTGSKFPISIIYEKRGGASTTVHPTQKPVALMEYLIRTYTNESQTVLDNAMGSGTTGLACVNTGRRFIGIERDEEYMKIAESRIQAAISAKSETFEYA